MADNLTSLLSAHRHIATYPIGEGKHSAACSCGHHGDHPEHLALIIRQYRHDLPVFGAARAVIHGAGCDCNPCSLNKRGR